MTDWVIRKFVTDVDEPVLAEPRKGFFVRFMEALRETRRRQALREIAKHAHLLSSVSWQQNGMSVLTPKGDIGPCLADVR
jgi:hypothetical protein